MSKIVTVGSHLMLSARHCLKSLASKMSAMIPMLPAVTTHGTLTHHSKKICSQERERPIQALVHLVALSADTSQPNASL